MIARWLSALLEIPRVARLREALTPPAYPGVRLTAKRLLNLYLSRWQAACGHTRILARPIKLTTGAAGSTGPV